MLKKKKYGLLIVISSPSGAGKTTICKNLVSIKLNTELSVSLTTREPRANEINGVDYNFVSINYFKKKIKKKSFLEHAKVFGNFYGTLKSSVLKKIKNGKNILLDIDWQGARQIKKIFPDETLSIFLLPPSFKKLKSRLKKRNHTWQFIKKRMSKAKKEIMHWNEYDYVVINNNLHKCLEQIKKIIELHNYRPFRFKMLKF